ncbi:CD83 antigen isoform X2 [Pristis pectinata]|uniref:CD83 antigen isoform X2 n=1 Tax=Pristis pectinata TaxID=685728 RepID=UPI00223E09B3|nr:CD83 antigen isoform X2 [Pristis pectinata]
MELLLGSTVNAFVILTLHSVLLYLGAEGTREIAVQLGEEARLPCEAQEKNEVQYHGISWYKVADDGIRLSGIILKNFNEKTPRKYRGCTTSVELSSFRPYTLIIYNISSEDMGTYHCSLWAPIGEENKKGFVIVKEMGGASSESMDWMMILSIASGLCLLSLLCLYLMIKKRITGKEDYTKLISKDLRDSSQIQGPFRDNILTVT